MAFHVRTTDPEHSNWWVIGGGTPINLYSEKEYPDVDVAYSLHQGLMLRVFEQQSKQFPRRASQRHDAFISHASEDKESIVKPLARALSRLGFDVWYDEFQLKVGDSLRRSIDRGLAKSRYGIVVLSKKFFAKEWSKYELDGLTAREVDGKKVILPVWHGVTRKDVVKYSPTLADRVALDTAKLSMRKIANAIAHVLTRRRLTGR